MTRNEFLSKLADELKKNNVVDYEDILSEYEQHFAFKMADGFIEEEIAAKLGNPAELASQFASGDEDEKRKGNKATTVIGLCSKQVTSENANRLFELSERLCDISYEKVRMI